MNFFPPRPHFTWNKREQITERSSSTDFDAHLPRQVTKRNEAVNVTRTRLTRFSKRGGTKIKSILFHGLNKRHWSQETERTSSTGAVLVPGRSLLGRSWSRSDQASQVKIATWVVVRVVPDAAPELLAEVVGEG